MWVKTIPLEQQERIGKHELCMSVEPTGGEEIRKIPMLQSFKADKANALTVWKTRMGNADATAQAETNADTFQITQCT